MPFTEEARAVMLTMWSASSDLVAQLGTDADTAVGSQEPVRFVHDGMALVNDAEIVFGRAGADLDKPVTHWFVMNDRLIAYDKLERPILLRKGERATFPAGSLRLELR